MITTFTRADRLRLAALFQSHEKTRYYLNGVCIEEDPTGGVRLAATDGHRAALFRDEAGHTNHTVIVAVPKPALAAIKACKSRDFVWFGIIDGDRNRRTEARIFDAHESGGTLEEIQERMADVTDQGVVWAGAVDLIDGIFPNIGATVPEFRGDASVGAHFNPTLLADFRQVCEDFGKPGSLRLFANGADAAYVDCGRRDFVGLIMPMRSETQALEMRGHAFYAPAWARRPDKIEIDLAAKAMVEMKE